MVNKGKETERGGTCYERVGKGYSTIEAMV